MEAARLLGAILHTGVCAEDAASLAAFTAGLGQEEQGLINAMLREKLPEQPVAVAQEYWRGLEGQGLERRRDVLLSRLRDPDLTPGEETEIQKLILDLQKRLTDISRPFSPPGPA